MELVDAGSTGCALCQRRNSGSEAGGGTYDGFFGHDGRGAPLHCRHYESGISVARIAVLQASGLKEASLWVWKRALLLVFHRGDIHLWGWGDLCDLRRYCKTKSPTCSRKPEVGLLGTRLFVSFGSGLDRAGNLPASERGESR